MCSGKEKGIVCKADAFGNDGRALSEKFINVGREACHRTR